MRVVIYVDNEQHCMRWAKPDNLHILKYTLTQL